MNDQRIKIYMVPIVILFFLHRLNLGTATTMTMVTLNEALPEASCLSGAPMIYYYELQPGAMQWIIYLRGGGWCYDQSDCEERSLGGHGTSTGYQSNIPPPDGLDTGILSDNSVQNPHFYNWNKIFLPYFDGGSFASDNPTPQGSFPIYYRGLSNFLAVIQDLIDNRGMDDATHILLTGCSAGGLATLFHCDRLAEIMQPYDTIVKCMSDAGFFNDVLSYVAGSSVLQTEFTNVFTEQQLRNGVNQACIAANPDNDEWKCMFPEYFISYIETPIFLLNSVYDSWQIPNVWLTSGVGQNQGPSSLPWSPCCYSNFPNNCTPNLMQILSSYANATLNDTRPAWLNNGPLPNVGTFITTCFIHCMTAGVESGGLWPEGNEISGISISQAIYNWFFDLQEVCMCMDLYMCCFFMFFYI